MTITVQNLRSVTPGVVPATLNPGQLCFNIADEIVFIGDGSSYQTRFDGTQTITSAGGGWFSVPLSFTTLGTYFIQNPAAFGDIPADGETIIWSSALGRPIWSNGTGGTPAVYTTTNAAVAAAPGATASDKITSALGIVPVEGDSVVVTGVPGDTYQGLYLFNGTIWLYAGGYAAPTAQQVTYNNSGSGLAANNVQTAIDELDAEKLPNASNSPSSGQFLGYTAGPDPIWLTISSGQIAFTPYNGNLATNVQDAIELTWDKAIDALTEANSAQADATAAQTTANIALTNSINAVNDAASALVIANQALPKSGGTMTGNIIFDDGQPVDAGTY